jgi:replication factor A1
MAEFQSVSQVKKMRSGINLKAEVKSKGEPRTVNLKTGGTVDVCDAVISDGSDDIKLTLWGDDIKAVNIGDVVVITNGYTNEFKGEVSLTKGKFGKMEVNPLNMYSNLKNND